MDGGASESTDGFPETSLVLAKAKGSNRKNKNTPPRRLVRSTVLVWLDIAQFVRDGMTALYFGFFQNIKAQPQLNRSSALPEQPPAPARHKTVPSTATGTADRTPTRPASCN